MENTKQVRDSLNRGCRLKLHLNLNLKKYSKAQTAERTLRGGLQNRENGARKIDITGKNWDL